MATFRQIHTKIWKDTWFIELEPEEKMLFIYLFTNEMSSISGIYELSMRVIIFETGLDKATIQRALDRFEKDGKVFYGDGVVWVANLRKYHETSSPKVKSRIDSDVAAVPDCELKNRYMIAYGYPIGTISGVENRVQIPPYMYSNSSSYSLNGVEGSESIGETNEIKRVAALVATVVKTPYGPGTNEDEFEQMALSLIGWGATDEQITTGFTEWWKVNGHYSGLPALKSYQTEFRNYLSGVRVVNKNGAHDDDLSIWQRVKDAVTFNTIPDLTEREKNALRAIGGRYAIKNLNEVTEGKVRASFIQALGAA